MGKLQKRAREEGKGDKPLLSTPNMFVRASLFRPDICRWMQHGMIDRKYFEEAVKAVKCDIESFCICYCKMAHAAFEMYVEECRNRPEVPFSV